MPTVLESIRMLEPTVAKASVQSIAQLLDVHPPISVLQLVERCAQAQREGRILFPENEVPIFRSYSLAAGGQTHQQVVQEIIDGLATAGGIPQEAKRAWTINRARRHLKDILQSTSAIMQGFEDAYAQMTHPEFGLALGILANIAPSTTMSVEGLELALTKEAVEWVRELKGEYIDGLLAGYSGPDIAPAFRELISNATEVLFRRRLLEAECNVGLRQFDKATELYTSLLHDLPQLASDRRKFVAIRAGLAHLALADALFRQARNLSDEQRTKVAAMYDAAVSVIQANGVAPENPIRTQIAEYAVMQKAKLAGYFNVLGFRDSFVPVQKHTFLEQQAKERIAAASAAAKSYLSYLATANAKEDLELELTEALKTAQATVQIARQRSRIALERINLINTQRAVLAAKELQLVAQIAKKSWQTFNDIVAGVINPQTLLSNPDPPSAVGITSTIVGFAAQSQELRHLKKGADLERQIAGLEQSIAELEVMLAQRREAFVEHHLNRTRGRKLNLEVYYALADTYKQLTESHLNEAIRLAYLYERAVAFYLGKPTIQHIRFDYNGTEADLVTAADRLDHDVLSISNELAEDKLPKRNRYPYTVSLRGSYPVEWAQFLQTRQMNFVISLYDLDKRRPGSYQARITENGVHLMIKGLVPETGYSANLTHMGQFLLRDDNSTLDQATRRLVPTDEQLQQALEQQQRGQRQEAAVGGVILYELGPDTMEFDLERVDNNNAQSPFRNLCEGYGPCGLWSLRLRDIDLRSISDIILRLNIEAFETDLFELAPKVQQLLTQYEAELAGGEALDRVTAISLRQHFPDVLSRLAAGPASLVLKEAHFPSTITNMRLKAVIGQAVDQANHGVEGINLEVAKPENFFTLIRTTGVHGFTEDLASDIPVLPPSDRFAAPGTWQIQLPDAGQVSGFNDLWLFLIYEYIERLPG